MRTIVPFLLLLCPAAPALAMETEVVRLHNQERVAWGVAPLRWDPRLAAAADRWARELARTDRWGHSPDGARGDQGENLWMGTASAFPLQAMVGSWKQERRWLRPGHFPAVSTTGRWKDVGHYTQMISSRTTHVGCALRSNARWSYFVCRYAPSGNVVGRRVP